MKLVMCSILLFSMNALANPVVIDIDGVRHACTPINDGPQHENAASCATLAYNGPFSKDEAMNLCQGARDAAPAQCAIQAYNGPFNKLESIQLCTRAHSTGPSECALMAYNGPFNKAETLSLCAAPFASKETASCAIQAYNGPYSKEEAIRMCQRSRSKSIDIPLMKDNLDELIKAANTKAVLKNEYK